MGWLRRRAARFIGRQGIGRLTGAGVFGSPNSIPDDTPGLGCGLVFGCCCFASPGHSSEVDVILAHLRPARASSQTMMAIWDETVPFPLRLQSHPWRTDPPASA
jgi:hypothetical protein